jgi:phosphoribosyl 1,2-cyclic phosphodiesterase
LRARIWGCRGSLATPGSDTVRYGGNTSCVEVAQDDGTVVILDAGTGLRDLGTKLAHSEPTSIHILLTHLHLDHIQGLGFFAPLWQLHHVDLHVWGPRSYDLSLEERIERYLSPPLFPVQFDDARTRPTFHDVSQDEWEIGNIRLSALPVTHPGPTVGFRLEENGRSLCYIPDHELALHGDAGDPLSGFDIARNADVLLHDAQYTEEEYPFHKGWGHSNVSDTVSFARACDVGTLVMFHHDPMHTDEYLEKMLERARELWGKGDGEPVLAYEGLEIELG